MKPSKFLIKFIAGEAIEVYTCGFESALIQACGLRLSRGLNTEATRVANTETGESISVNPQNPLTANWMGSVIKRK